MADPEDVERVRARLGREPQAEFEVVVRAPDGEPVVIRNAAFLFDGTPMPTRYWLVDPELNRSVSHVEAGGGVRAAQAEIGLDRVAEAHDRYAAERDATIPADYSGPRPAGGVGGTRVGVKCLHAHYAAFLAGTGDPVGAWVANRLRASTEESP